MALSPPSPHCGPACDCNPSQLLGLAIDLIDPPQGDTAATKSSDDHKDCINDDETITPPSIDNSPTKINGADGLVTPHGTELSSSQTAKKKVTFGNCPTPRRLVLAGDAIRAYDLLMHAASIISSSCIIQTDGEDGFVNINVAKDTSWETLRIIADIYRALLVTSCLLMELLPTPDLSNDDDASNNDGHRTIQSASTTSRHKCHILRNNMNFIIPNLSSSIEKRLLSTCRRSILLLQALERICTAKAVADRHNEQSASFANASAAVAVGTNAAIATDDNTTANNAATITTANFYLGGDDIPEYDRSISDLHNNYDWHDDGHLPPSLHHILQQCCYRPKYQTDPPSSRYEKSAWTRDWIRGDRLVSLSLDEYQYGEGMVLDEDGDGDFEGSYAADEDAINDEGDISEIGEGDGDVSLDISPDALVAEEDCLLDIMLPAVETSPSPNNHFNTHGGSRVPAMTAKSCNKKRWSNAKEKRRKKRQRKENAAQRLEELKSTTDATSHVGQRVHIKEGFLLLIQSDPHLSNRARMPIRVYARLQPSGVLSIEDRSIHCQEDCIQSNDSTIIHQQHLASRVRYWDYLIGARTKCEPSMQEGASSFHFRLDCARLLGASSLCRSSDKNGDNTNNDGKEEQFPLSNDLVAAYRTTSILFSVDEGTGGAFMDGYEWVNALSGVATGLSESIQAEWGEE